MARIKSKSIVKTEGLKLNTIKDFLKSRKILKYGIASKIARNLGVSANIVCMWMRNERNPPIAQFLRLAAYLECEVSDLIVKENPFKVEN